MPTSELQAPSPWLGRYAVLTGVATLGLLGIGGVVTSKGVGMAVPDWPTSYGYNMFLLPWSHWVGGALYEHSHRLVASVVGLLVVGLTRWLGGSPSRLPLAIVGASELLGGLLLVQAAPGLRGTGHFLAGIGVVVLLAAVVWKRHAAAPKPLPLLGWLAFVTVQLQGLLGGLRVVWLKDEIGIFHATLAQLFFLLICVVALLTTRRWSGFMPKALRGASALAAAAVTTTILIVVQLIVGATMRHQHAGLAIPDFPLAYGKIWPAMDSASIETYNQTRLEVLAQNPITAFQVALQMVHRTVAGAILAGVLYCSWLARRNLGRHNPSAKLAFVWLGLILLQVILGAATIWTNKAADVATAHVVVGALSLAAGAFVCIVTLRQCEAGVLAQAGHATARPKASPSGLRHPATGLRMRHPAA